MTLLLALGVWLALAGVVRISAAGVDLDRDLSSYAAITAIQMHGSNFAADPVAASSQAHAGWNLFRQLGLWLTPGQEYGLGLLYAGALTIFVFYLGYYLLGRWLWGSPLLAVLLSALMGITVWVGWGTFWGVLYSDPVPRVLFGALFPFLLMAAVTALDRPSWRAPVMLLTGLCVWVHNVSALSCGAMFFMAFFLHRGEASRATHWKVLTLCLLCFFVPVLISLRSLLDASGLQSGEKELWHRLFAIRLSEDYGRMFQSLKAFLWHYAVLLPLLPAGLAAWAAALHMNWFRRRLSPRMAAVYGMLPAMVLALAVMAAVSLAEDYRARAAGNIPAAQDLVRGLRFLIPLAWLSLVGGVACLWPLLHRAVRFAAVAGLCVLLAGVSPDHWNRGMLYALDRYVPLPLSLAAEKAEQAANESRRAALKALQELTPPQAVIFSDNGEAGIRYSALRSLFYSYKDGFLPYYTRNVPVAKHWLTQYERMQGSATAYIEAWLASGCRWLLCSRPQDKDLLTAHGKLRWQNEHWLIVERR